MKQKTITKNIKAGIFFYLALLMMIAIQLYFSRSLLGDFGDLYSKQQDLILGIGNISYSVFIFLWIRAVVNCKNQFKSKKDYIAYLYKKTIPTSLLITVTATLLLVFILNTGYTNSPAILSAQLFLSGWMTIGIMSVILAVVGIKKQSVSKNIPLAKSEHQYITSRFIFNKSLTLLFVFILAVIVGLLCLFITPIGSWYIYTVPSLLTFVLYFMPVIAISGIVALKNIKDKKNVSHRNILIIFTVLATLITLNSIYGSISNLIT